MLNRFSAVFLLSLFLLVGVSFSVVSETSNQTLIVERSWLNNTLDKLMTLDQNFNELEIYSQNLRASEINLQNLLEEQSITINDLESSVESLETNLKEVETSLQREQQLTTELKISQADLEKHLTLSLETFNEYRKETDKAIENYQFQVMIFRSAAIVGGFAAAGAILGSGFDNTNAGAVVGIGIGAVVAVVASW